ncbi:hypothetical protein FRC11_012576 [Ceratobasidium sp. 423]|nr:hypothetical protein FRC11_012576 [Ceratobasidium sp. 423]
MIMSLCSWRDGFLTVATGQGKSTLIQGPIVADLVAGIDSIGVTLVPTKCLADDQARSASAKGIRALALHEDSLREARESSPSRDLFEEVAKGEWSLIFIGPEMIMSPAFDKLLRRKTFITRFRYFTVDEVHLIEDWNNFRSSFNDVSRLRNRFLDSVVWLSLSATIAKGKETRRLKDTLGFGPETKTIHLPVDRPWITYAPRFIKHSFSGDDFLDLAWVIPRSARRPSDIPITVIFIELIDSGERLDRFLTSLLPPDFVGDPRKLIRLFNSVSSASARARDAEALREGSETQILICTDTGTFGLDIPQVKIVVAVQPNHPLFRTMCQKMGRIRTSGKAIVYFKKWMSLEQTSKSAQASLEVAARRKELKVRSQVGQIIVPVVPRSTCEFPPLDNRLLQPAALGVFRAWRSNWRVARAFYGPLVSEHMLISDKMLQTLCKRLHICTTLDRFRTVLWNWDYLNVPGWDTNLFSVVLQVLNASIRLRVELEKASLLPAKRALTTSAGSSVKRTLTVKKEE